MSTYNPFRNIEKNTGSGIFNNIQDNSSFFNNRLFKLSSYTRNYSTSLLKNAAGINRNEDLSQIRDNGGNSYSLFSSKVNALMQDKQTIAALSPEYYRTVQVLREYATKNEIREYVSKMANEIIVYQDNNYFCELNDLPNNYSKELNNKLKTIFETIYRFSGFDDGAKGWDLCRDWLVDGYLCREIIYDNKGKNIIGFQELDPVSIIPIVDPESGIKIWLQYPNDETNRRVILDSKIIYISYSGSSNYMETSYVEPLIRPYNELKTLERSRVMFNLINATLHKQIIIPTHGLPPGKAEEEVLTVISDYKDDVAFDDTTGVTHIDGQKNLPYSKEYWLPDNGESSPSVEYIDPAGHDLNENTTLNWFKNSFKQATKFPLSRLDGSTGGGNVYSIGSELTHDDYNFQQYVKRLKVLFKEIILKPVKLQLLNNYPEYENEHALLNAIDINFYGHSELIKAKQLANMQAKASIASDLQNNFKKINSEGEEVPVLHWKMISKHIMEFDDEFMEENDRFWAEDENKKGPDGGDGGGGDGGGDSGDDGDVDLDGGDENVDVDSGSDISDDEDTGTDDLNLDEEL